MLKKLSLVCLFLMLTSPAWAQQCGILGCNSIFNASKEVGIGSSVISYPLQVVADGTPYSTSSTAQFAITGATNPNFQLLLGYDINSNLGYIQAIKQGVGNTNLYLESGGGNLCDGNCASGASSKLSVVGNASIGTYSATAAPSNGLIITGSVGIGTAAPANALDVNGSLAVGTYAGTTTGASNELIVGGNVGIGTTAPAQTLEVNGTAKIDTGLIAGLIYPTSNSTTAIQFDKANGSTNVVDIDTTNGRVGIGTTAPQTLLSLGSTLTTIKVAAFDPGTGSGVYGMGVNTNLLAFGAAIAVNGTPQMVLSSSGNVGIGTTTMANKLDINGAASIGYVNTAAPSNGLIVSGNVGIGTVTPQAPLAVYGLSSGAITSDYACYDTTDGRFTYQTSNCTASLREMKDNIQPYTTGLTDALALKPTTFFMKNEHNLGEEIGLIAQDAEKVNKDLAVYQDGKLRSVQYDRTGVVAIAAIQDLQREINSLREQLQLPPRHCNVFCEVREFFEGL